MKTELCLGTVQFGLNYGINNSAGRLPEKEVFRLLDHAVSNGVNILDTSSAYGDAECILGNYISTRRLENIRIITKLNPKMDFADERDVSTAIQKEVEDALERLQVNSLEGYLLHNEEHVYQEGVLETLEKLKSMSKIKHIGISAYSEKVASDAIQTGEIDYLQIPYNIFDQRIMDGSFQKLCRDHQITVFGRSPFLQGLFFMSPEDAEMNVMGSGKWLTKLHAIAREANMEIAELALRFVLDSQCVNYLVFGVDHMEHLKEVIRVYHMPPLSKVLMDEMKRTFVSLEDRIIKPYLWQLRSR